MLEPESFHKKLEVGMNEFTLNDLPPNPYISMLLHEATAKLSDDVAKAEESFIIKAIVLAGYEPSASDDAEWRKHVTLHYGGVGHKVVAVDGAPKWAIITELQGKFPDSVSAAVYMTRMEEVPYDW